MEIYLLGILILSAGGILSLFFNEKFKLKIVSFFACLSTALIIPSLFISADKTLGISSIFGEISFATDPLSAFFAGIISIFTSLATIYANGYTAQYFGKNKKTAAHCFFLPVLISAMLLVVTVQNAFYFLIIWEIMSLSSFFLVIFEDEKKEVISAGIKYLIYMHISVIFLILAFVLMINSSGSYNFSDFKAIFVDYPNLKNSVYVLSLIGFGIKSGFFPMHNWLPDAHPAAPSHVSAMMSAVMIKTGIYGILRILTLIGTPTKFMAYSFMGISVITALYAIIYGIGQKDIKKLLAYSSIENIGLIGIGISTALFGKIYDNPYIMTLGLAGCFLHILNHSTFKNLLFMSAGSIYTKTHTRNIEELGGLIKKMPYTGVFFLFGVIAISALPPLNGFISEFLMFSGLINIIGLNSDSNLFIAGILSLASMGLVGTLVILAMTKLYFVSFLGLPRSKKSEKVANDVDKTMLIPMGICSLLTVVIPVSVPYLCKYFLPLNLFGNNTEKISSVITMLSDISLILIGLSAFIAALYGIKRIMTKNSRTYITWGCGYEKVNNRIQYSASSYVAPFLNILTPMLKKIFDVKKPKGFFPEDAHYNSEIKDTEEEYLINPVLKLDEKFLSKFERLQDGNIQHYILYGLIFLILMLTGVLFIQ